MPIDTIYRVMVLETQSLRPTRSESMWIYTTLYLGSNEADARDALLVSQTSDVRGTFGDRIRETILQTFVASVGASLNAEATTTENPIARPDPPRRPREMIYRVMTRETGNYQWGNTVWSHTVKYIGTGALNARIAFHQSQPLDIRGRGDAPARETIFSTVNQSELHDSEPGTMMAG